MRISALLIGTCAVSRLWRIWKSVYDLDLIEIGLSALYGFSVRPWFQYYAAVARSRMVTDPRTPSSTTHHAARFLCDSRATCYVLTLVLALLRIILSTVYHNVEYNLMTLWDCFANVSALVAFSRSKLEISHKMPCFLFTSWSHR